MTLPRLNQTITLYQTNTFDEYGTQTVSNTTTFQGRLVEAQDTSYDARGNEATFDGHLHLNNIPDLQEGNIISYNDKLYKIHTVTKTRDLNGNVKFQYCQLVIQAGVKTA